VVDEDGLEGAVVPAELTLCVDGAGGLGCCSVEAVGLFRFDFRLEPLTRFLKREDIERRAARGEGRKEWAVCRRTLSVELRLSGRYWE